MLLVLDLLLVLLVLLVPSQEIPLELLLAPIAQLVNSVTQLMVLFSAPVANQIPTQTKLVPEVVHYVPQVLSIMQLVLLVAKTAQPVVVNVVVKST